MSTPGHPNADLARLYRDAIRQHSAEPVGFRQPIEATHSHEEYNPQCGDRVEIMLRVADGRIEAAAFDGEACAICTASASMLCSLAPGRAVEELRELRGGLEAALKEPVGAPGTEGVGATEGAGAPVGAASAAKNRPKNPSRLKPLPQNPPLPQSPPLPHNPPLPQLQPLLGVRPYPSRVQCALLPWVAADRALSG